VFFLKKQTADKRNAGGQGEKHHRPKMWPRKAVTEFRKQTSKSTKLKYFGQARAAAS